MSDDRIHVECPNCQAKLRVPAEKAGHTIKCRKCKQAMEVPAVEETAELTAMQWVTVAGTVVLLLSVAFFFVRPSGQLWRVVGVIGLVTIAVPHHKEIWDRTKAGVKAMTRRRPKAPVEQVQERHEPQPPRQEAHQQQPIHQPRTVVIQDQPRRGGCLAALVSAFIPGLGQFLSGRFIAGFMWFMVVTIGAFVLWPTIIGPPLLWLVNVCDAASGGSSQQKTIVVS